MGGSKRVFPWQILFTGSSSECMLHANMDLIGWVGESDWFPCYDEGLCFLHCDDGNSLYLMMENGRLPIELIC